jgi:hypothetical protein
VTWVREKVALLEQRPEYGGLHVVGLVTRRHCGCEAQVGMRLDLDETTFGVHPCREHGVHTARALDTFKHMPPQDRHVFDLWEQLFEREIELVPA